MKLLGKLKNNSIFTYTVNQQWEFHSEIVWETEDLFYIYTLNQNWDIHSKTIRENTPAFAKF